MNPRGICQGSKASFLPGLEELVQGFEVYFWPLPSNNLFVLNQKCLKGNNSLVPLLLFGGVLRSPLLACSPPQSSEVGGAVPSDRLLLQV